ncbi:glutathione S-transferase family protein [Paucibacter sp. O1-1]|nr:glutathione S-transferase family protein [Paucibacter sp. O1-1]MDA3827359.1 glutathione S-transferase family protein [Paucibacter sp. O1-1]
MLTLYHCLSARSFRPLWALEELGLNYQLIVLPFPPRVHDKGYLALNPLGTVPLLLDGETRLTESAAICQYLAARHDPGGLDVGMAEADYGAYLNLLHFGEATLTFPQTLLLRYRFFEPAERRQPQVVEDYAKWFLARLRTLEPRLAAQDWLCAGRFTAADISVGYALLLARHLGLDAQFTPAVAAYWARLQQRDGWRRTLAVQTEAAQAQGISPIAAPDIRP